MPGRAVLQRAAGLGSSGQSADTPHSRRQGKDRLTACQVQRTCPGGGTTAWDLAREAALKISKPEMNRIRLSRFAA